VKPKIRLCIYGTLSGKDSMWKTYSRNSLIKCLPPYGTVRVKEVWTASGIKHKARSYVGMDKDGVIYCFRKWHIVSERLAKSISGRVD